MSLYKNVANQKLVVYVENTALNTPYVGVGGTVTASISLDGAGYAATNDATPTEIGGGLYYFSLTQAETNTDLVILCPQCSSSNSRVYPVVVRTLYQPFKVGSVIAGSTGLTVVTSLVEGNDYWNGCTVAFTKSNSVQGLSRKVDDYANSGGTLTLDNSLPAAPASGDEFILIGRNP